MERKRCGSQNDLAEDTRNDIDMLYTAIAEMSAKPEPEEKPRRRIGYRLASDEEVTRYNL
jgi:hypothetical protein